MKDIGRIEIEQYKPLRDIVFETLREAILSGKLKPGERVMEVQLAEKLGVSRTPVREAIRKLELEGLLVMIPRKGAYVADVSIKDVLNVLEIRASLEGLAASLAAERITDDEIKELKEKAKEFEQMSKENNKEGMIQKDTEFHNVLLNASRNDKLVNIVEGLGDQVQRFRVIYFTEYKNDENIKIEHSRIVDAISKRDSEKADEVAQEHIGNIGNYLLNQITQKKEG
ncbi:transcriptional regulator, GntR family [Gottschalkia acidurici 9a]|uniref:Transcriptional regulator, GntR family n=1 Tax=Gottschalkia acidurici (strain ATCC 7906 / DSM 604 / BCRC 14475 / CIP 104303 / KCTC 5404 / NCIMB 10678 / 9a) TaxID=1128398 RepID=K0AXT9_GOTA9|nr:GntR family transcriptional regulator [Gottschalkia acidurici]AFS77231.1 transcriptional regulator, GntR family [Gottschalkia acidurici 9a]